MIDSLLQLEYFATITRIDLRTVLVLVCEQLIKRVKPLISDYLKAQMLVEAYFCYLARLYNKTV